MTAEGGGGILLKEDVLANGIPHPASPGAPFYKGAFAPPPPLRGTSPIKGEAGEAEPYKASLLEGGRLPLTGGDVAQRQRG